MTWDVVSKETNGLVLTTNDVNQIGDNFFALADQSSGAPVITFPNSIMNADAGIATTEVGSFGSIHVSSFGIFTGATSEDNLVIRRNTNAEGALAAGADENWHVVDSPGGSSGEPKFQNTWVHNGGTHPPISFRRDIEGRVWFVGVAVGGTIGLGNAIFYLPVGYRPIHTVNLASLDGTSAFSRIRVLADGEVSMSVDNGSSIILFGSFWTNTVSG